MEQCFYGVQPCVLVGLGARADFVILGVPFFENDDKTDRCLVLPLV